MIRLMQNRSLSPLKEFLLTLCRLKRGLTKYQYGNLIVKLMPKEFKMFYPNTRVIVGTSEIFMQRPSNHLTEQATFSSYKNHNTAKALVGITPPGSVSFISRLYRRSISDRSLFYESSILKKMDIGDSVMADRGFNVADILDVRGMKLNAPPRKW
uniref:DDE Tnp4 domain-containing protein n=1 Tax=Amphimedon queenslandica TaxID=400682 RepID=A0A1X7TY40_AMPQE